MESAFTSPSRTEEYNKLAAALGRLAITFAQYEQVIDSMIAAGLKLTWDQRIAVTSGLSSIRREELLRTVGDIEGDSETGMMMKGFADRFKEIREARNQLIHGVYLIGDGVSQVSAIVRFRAHNKIRTDLKPVTVDSIDLVMKRAAVQIHNITALWDAIEGFPPWKEFYDEPFERAIEQELQRHPMNES